MEKSPKAQAELFHLLFLRQLHQQIEANLYSIKGGCNLRFFFNSIRYSEDLDIDVHIIQKETLEKKVNGILASPVFLRTLQAYDITSIHFSSPKQSAVTQRWKIQLQIANSDLLLPTKIEFSRRQHHFKSELTSIAALFCQQYKFPPCRLSHYGSADALEQKILALAHRSLTQTRDVFDIHLLLHQASPASLPLEMAVLKKAKNALFSLHFSDYQSQVVNFLEPQHQKDYKDKKAWESIVNMVAEYLSSMQK